ncbi:DUF4190 domain-containing protein [Galbitalea sp. SE-J8]|uniref:DUF4190 domain-containing protein n=1 Tax=Galbitalea sp. SE-J8 TaxID=3054952 RepID=UPI00259C9F16|nr:DUF4190 domain-containing protein [Galbitalea sp. SE-J8]MDM4763331.1 DUF4190 domain-containing protein [Galbitalea sp. SE-J8]
MTAYSPEPTPPATPGTPVPPPVGVDYPGKTLGIVGLVLAFVFAIAGLIVSIIAQNQSKAAGYKNTPAKVGLILSIVFIVLWILFWVLWAVIFAAALGSGYVTTY